MSVYKVPQDVEADDKFFGPLSFKQFLFGGGALISGYGMFLSFSNEIWPLMAVLLPVFIFFGALAFPWSKDQPTELWLAARIRFFLVPRKRIWNQTGMKDLVTITVPKREVHIYSDGLSQDQVRNRLNALATVVDTRGWAIKDYAQPAVLPPQIPQSPQASSQPSMPLPAMPQNDRLVDTPLPQAPTTLITEDTEDVLDEKQSVVAQQFNTMLEESSKKHHDETMAMIQKARLNAEQKAGADTESIDAPAPKPKRQKQPTPDPLSFMQAPDAPAQNDIPLADPNFTTFHESAVFTPGQSQNPATVLASSQASTAIDADAEQALLAKVHQKEQLEHDLQSHSHLKIVKPIDDQSTEIAEYQLPMVSALPTDDPAIGIPPSATPVDPAILALARNDDLNVETIARQAKKDKLDDDTEVVISLH